MNLATLLTANQIVPQMQSTDHWEAIVELVEHLQANGFIDEVQRDPVLEALREREEKISTGVGHGVAIPHAFSDEVENVTAVFGRSDEGIEFDALDNSPVNFVILFVVPRSEYHMHLKTLAAIAKLFTSREVRDNLRVAESADEILAIFSQRPARSA
ncbi:MAG: PTS sugar transporter subunit IIA [Verrucomicrobiota bacterium]